MAKRWWFILVLLLCAPTIAPAQATIPDTAAGRTFKAFLDAFNSGDRAKIDAYYRTYGDSSNPSAMPPPDAQMQFHNMTGGFDVLQIVNSEPLHLEAVVKERNSSNKGLATLDVKQGEPATVVDMQIRLLPPGFSVSDLNHVMLDATTKARVIDGALARLNEFYVSPELARQMEEAIRVRQKKGEFDSVTEGSMFAAVLTQDLREVSHDKHLGVNFSSVPLPEQPPDAKPSPEALAAMRKQMERTNCGFENVQVLADNVGYVKFNMFADPDICGPTAIAAMNFLANADAAIFDLRANGGGDPRMVSLICSYLFAEPTHLNDIWERKSDTTQQYWTLPYVPGKRLDTKPAFVLTSKQTFSGAEEFAYDLQNLKRATIVGETTGGGAHLVRGDRIDAHFMIGVPFAKAVNPISKTDWEGTGVIPDVKVPSDEALSTAEKLAAQKLTVAH
jgi:retinol-binding protein 3